MLTQQQVDAIRRRNARAVGKARGRRRRPHATLFRAGEEGDRKRGAAVYETYCASCHGAGGRGGEKAGSIVAGSFLALVSNQSLRTMVIVGRPDLGAPDFSGNLPDAPCRRTKSSDVVAWLSAQRTQGRGAAISGRLPGRE